VEGKLTKRDNTAAPAEMPRLSSELTSDYTHG
jgi:hypothetical protein